MSNYYAPCLYKINFVVIPSYIELPCRNRDRYWKTFQKADTSKKRTVFFAPTESANWREYCIRNFKKSFEISINILNFTKWIEISVDIRNFAKWIESSVNIQNFTNWIEISVNIQNFTKWTESSVNIWNFTKTIEISMNIWNFTKTIEISVNIRNFKKPIEISVNIWNFANWIEVSMFIRIVRIKISLIVRNTLREKAPSRKTPGLIKSGNMGI